MKQLIKSLGILTAIGTLAACGGAGGEVTDPPPPPGEVDEPIAPIISATTVGNARSFISGVNNRRDTPGISILPSGTATYNGEMLTNLSINGESSVDGLIGDVRLTAQLFGAGDRVTGTVTNIHTLDGNNPVERLSGQLAIEGTLEDGSKEMTSSLTGQLTGVVGDGEAGALDITGVMNGHTQDTAVVNSIPNPIPLLPPISVTTYDEATGIFGSTSGNINGSETGTFSGTWAVSE
ncbi:MAG: hypothetical protein AAFP98_00715 [Pseudomonadota bacterium]